VVTPHIIPPSDVLLLQAENCEEREVGKGMEGRGCYSAI